MKYQVGGVTAPLGEALIVEVPLNGKPPAAGGSAKPDLDAKGEDKKPEEKKPDAKRDRGSAQGQAGSAPLDPAKPVKPETAGAHDEDDEEEAVGASQQQEPEPTGKKETCPICGQPRKHCEMKSRPKTTGGAIEKVELDVRLLHQFDPRWSKVTYFDRGTIGEKGCLLTSLTMIIGFLRRSTLEGERPNPQQMLDYVSRHSHKGGWTQGCAFYPNPESQPEPNLVLRNFPSKSRMIDFDHQHATLDKIDECLDRGLPVCVDVLKPENYTKALHYVVVYGRKADGKYLIRDPGYRKPVELGPQYRAIAEIYWFEPA